MIGNDRFYIDSVWTPYQWGYTVTIIENENLTSLTLSDFEGSFIHCFTLNIVSVAIHRNDDQKKFRFLKKIFFDVEDLFQKKLSWKLYQWRYTGTIVKNKNLNFLKSFFIERSFLQKIVLDIVSMGVHRNDDQTRELEFC